MQKNVLRIYINIPDESCTKNVYTSNISKNLSNVRKNLWRDTIWNQE